MGTVYGVNRTYANTADTITMIPRGAQGAPVYTMYDMYECSSTAAATVIEMGSDLPKGARILMFQASWDDMGSSTCTIDIGTSYNDDEFASAIDVQSAAGASTAIIVGDSDEGVGYVVGTNSGDSQITVTINTNAASGTLKLVVFYSL